MKMKLRKLDFEKSFPEVEEKMRDEMAKLYWKLRDDISNVTNIREHQVFLKICLKHNLLIPSMIPKRMKFEIEKPEIYQKNMADFVKGRMAGLLESTILKEAETEKSIRDTMVEIEKLVPEKGMDTWNDHLWYLYYNYGHSHKSKFKEELKKFQIEILLNEVMVQTEKSYLGNRSPINKTIKVKADKTKPNDIKAGEI